MESYEWEQQTEAYLNGRMSAEELTAFEALLRSNTELRSYVALSQDLKATVEGSLKFETNPSESHVETVKAWYKAPDTLAFADSLTSVDIPTKDRSKLKTQKKYWLPLIAASLIGVLLAINWSLQKPNIDSLYHQYSQWDSMPSFVVQGTGNENATKIEMETAFKSQNYEQALSLATALLNTGDAPDYNVLLYKGITLIELERWAEAQAVFDSLINSPAIDAQKGHWYKALIHLKLKEMDALNEILDLMIEDTNHIFYQKALQLKEELE